MNFISYIDRRQFIVGSSAAVAIATSQGRLLSQITKLISSATSPEEINGRIKPLLKGHTDRPLRYHPVDGDILVRNGTEFFNRPLYGPNNAFRVDAGDLPEFSLYLPGHGGNLRLGIASSHAMRWLAESEEVISKYHAGRMIYEVRDETFQGGTVNVELCTMGYGAGVYVRAQVKNATTPLRLLWAFGGVSGRKGKRGGDIGCESEPVSHFFQMRPNECSGNIYSISDNAAYLHSAAADLVFTFPENSELHLTDAVLWNDGWDSLKRSSSKNPALPILIGSTLIEGDASLYITIQRASVEGVNAEKTAAEAAHAFSLRSRQLDALAASLALHTPDPYIDSMVRPLNIAADALWDDAAGCVMHGAVAWRVPLAGWRGPYALDVLGQHERFQKHAHHWIARQNLSPVVTAVPAVGVPDPGSHLARTESLLHSRGDLSHNHYDMNLVFFDALLRHLQWTGDLDFAHEIWPALKLHLEWERRLFRRTYTIDGKQLPLYEGYACIWASDNLQYNGGGAAHATAYNYYANRCAAQVARLIDEDPTSFELESQQILAGMQQLLWLPQKGSFGESKDIVGPQRVYDSPALWTVYHVIDSEIPDAKQSWQMAVERLHALVHVPIHGNGVPDGDWYLLSCSDWLPYMWSLNLLLLGENMHMALALWQTGIAEEAFKIFKGNILDSMFMGITPGNFHMTSQFDVHRQEAQRDFGDPIGVSARALVEGLYGIKPDLLHDRLTIRPGFPADWQHASIQHPDLDFTWQQDGTHEVFDVQSRFARPIILSLVTRARSTRLPIVLINGSPAPCIFDPDAVGHPTLTVTTPKDTQWTIKINWHEDDIQVHPPFCVYKIGQRMILPPKALFLEDPQGALRDGFVSLLGIHTVFARMEQNDCKWWLPISFNAEEATSRSSANLLLGTKEHAEAINLSAYLKHHITDIFTRDYREPRSPFCSLSIPKQGIGGWAAFDTQPVIDDVGLRAAGGILHTPFGVPFLTPASAHEANCLFVSCWQQDQSAVQIQLSGRANRIHLLMAGTTFPQASRMEHGVVTVRYFDDTTSTLSLRNPETWWPIEQDYLLDDYLFVNHAPLPSRVDLRTGEVRILDAKSFKRQEKMIQGGAATILTLSLDPSKELKSLHIGATLYGIVIGLLAVTLVRTS